MSTDGQRGYNFKLVRRAADEIDHANAHAHNLSVLLPSDGVRPARELLHDEMRQVSNITQTILKGLEATRVSNPFFID